MIQPCYLQVFTGMLPSDQQGFLDSEKGMEVPLHHLTATKPFELTCCHSRMCWSTFQTRL